MKDIEAFNKFVEKAGQLTLVQRILIAAGLLLLLIGGFVYFGYMPKFDELNELRADKEQVEMQLANAQQKASQLKKVESDLKAAKEKFERVRRVIPEKVEIPSLLQNISRSGSEADLEFTLFKPVKEVEKDFYKEIPVSISVSGNYHNVAIFFDKISNLPRIVNIKDVKMSAASKEKASNKSLLDVSCTAVTYKFLEKPNAEEKNKKK